MKAVRDLARQILALEDGKSGPSGTNMGTAMRVFEKLRVRLSKLVGLSGFQALLLRARALASVEAPWLGAVQIAADGTIEGFGESVPLNDADALAAGSARFWGSCLDCW